MIPTFRDKPIEVGWWWLQFCDGPGPRFWDGTFWKQGSIFSAAEDYAQFPIIAKCLLPNEVQEIKDNLDRTITTLRVIADLPIPEQDNMIAANMRKVASNELG